MSTRWVFVSVIAVGSLWDVSHTCIHAYIHTSYIRIYVYIYVYACVHIYICTYTWSTRHIQTDIDAGIVCSLLFQPLIALVALGHVCMCA